MRRLIAVVVVLFIFFSCGSTPDVTVAVVQEEQVVEDNHETLVIGEPQAYIAISDFDVLSDDEVLQSLSKDIPQEITSAFLKGGAVKPVEREEFSRLVDEIKLSMSYSDEEAMLEAGKMLGADFVLLGSFSKIGAQCKINFRLVKTETSEILFADSARGLFDNIFDLEDEVAGIIEEHIVQ